MRFHVFFAKFISIFFGVIIKGNRKNGTLLFFGSNKITAKNNLEQPITTEGDITMDNLLQIFFGFIYARYISEVHPIFIFYQARA